MEAIPFQLRGEYIELNKLLKATGVCESGGQASALIVEGEVKVDGRRESRKAAKIRPGQIVQAGGARITVLAPSKP